MTSAFIFYQISGIIYFMRRNLPKNSPRDKFVTPLRLRERLEREDASEYNFEVEVEIVFGSPSGIASDIYFLADCFKAVLGSVLT